MAELIDIPVPVDLLDQVSVQSLVYGFQKLNL
jgi:hypothetical protein